MASKRSSGLAGATAEKRTRRDANHQSMWGRSPAHPIVVSNNSFSDQGSQANPIVIAADDEEPMDVNTPNQAANPIVVADDEEHMDVNTSQQVADTMVVADTEATKEAAEAAKKAQWRASENVRWQRYSDDDWQRRRSSQEWADIAKYRRNIVTKRSPRALDANSDKTMEPRQSSLKFNSELNKTHGLAPPVKLCSLSSSDEIPLDNGALIKGASISAVHNRRGKRNNLPRTHAYTKITPAINDKGDIINSNITINGKPLEKWDNTKFATKDPGQMLDIGDQIQFSPNGPTYIAQTPVVDVCC